jgi:hypothetical protein
MYTQSTSDVLMATCNLVTISTLCDELIEKDRALCRTYEMLANEHDSYISITGDSHSLGNGQGAKLATGAAMPVPSEIDSGKKDLLEKTMSKQKQKRADSPVFNTSSRRNQNDNQNQEPDSADLSLTIEDDDSRSPSFRANRKVSPAMSVSFPTTNTVNTKGHWNKNADRTASKVLLDSDAKFKIQKVQLVKGSSGYQNSVGVPAPRASEDVTVMHLQQQSTGNSNPVTFKQEPTVTSKIAPDKPRDRTLLIPGKNNKAANSSKSPSSMLELGSESPQHNGSNSNHVDQFQHDDCEYDYNDVSRHVNTHTHKKTFRQNIRSLQRLPSGVVNTITQCSRALNMNLRHTPAGAGEKPALKNKHCKSTYVWTSGQNSYGELGHGDVNQRKSYVKMTALEGKNITCIGAGNEHTVFVNTDGQVLVCGYNENGQCGLGTTAQVRQVSTIPGLEKEDVKQVHVYNGCEHTLIVTTDGKLFSFGYNYRG